MSAGPVTRALKPLCLHDTTQHGNHNVVGALNCDRTFAVNDTCATGVASGSFHHVRDNIEHNQFAPLHTD